MMDLRRCVQESGGSRAEARAARWAARRSPAWRKRRGMFAS